MTTKALHARIRRRLADLNLSSREASLAGGLSQDAISKLLRKPEHSQTLATIDKLAAGLKTSPAWLAYGIAVEAGDPVSTHPGQMRLDRSLLRQALEFVLTQEGIEPERAAIVADILPEALEGSPVDAVQKDPFLSFRVHFQLGSEHPEPR